mgnify:FL=1
MATVSLNKIIDKFIKGESMVYSSRSETLPIEYYAELRECTTLEDLVEAVETCYDFDEYQSYKYVLDVLDYEDD